MMQSSCQKPEHIAIIMDGNGRWAESRRLPRVRGHLAGADAVRRAVRGALGQGVPCLTLYAFSCENWRRPSSEVQALMTLFGRYLESETHSCVERGIRLSVVGRRDRLESGLVSRIERTERMTSGGKHLRLRIAVDYSARDAASRAAERLALRGAPYTVTAFEHALAEATHSDADTPPIDLLIRTGGELRLSDQMAWEAAYAELLFLGKMWPDFYESDLAAACEEFAKRQRRFGGLPIAG